MYTPYPEHMMESIKKVEATRKNVCLRNQDV